MNIRNAILSLVIVSVFSHPAFSQNEQPDSEVEIPQPAQIFPNDVQKTIEDSRRNEREMKKYKAKQRLQQDQNPD
jgi:hypothetical protein